MRVRSNNDLRLGVFDWGAGGMGLVKHLRAKHSNWPLCYLSDAGYTPYGKVPAAELARRVQTILHWFRAQGVTQVAVACNAASSVFPASRKLGDRQRLSTSIETPSGALQVTHVVQHALASRALLRVRTVGVVGGQRTIRSGMYRALSPRCHVVSRVAQPLSAFVEAGELTSERVKTELHRILGPLQHVDALILACTHYPALLPLFQAALPNVTLVDPAADMARWIVKHWSGTRSAPVGSHYFTTGDPLALSNTAQSAFGVTLTRAAQYLKLP